MFLAAPFDDKAAVAAFIILGYHQGGSWMEKKTFVQPTLKEEASLAEVTLFSPAPAV